MRPNKQIAFFNLSSYLFDESVFWESVINDALLVEEAPSSNFAEITFSTFAFLAFSSFSWNIDSYTDKPHKILGEYLKNTQSKIFLAKWVYHLSSKFFRGNLLEHWSKLKELSFLAKSESLPLINLRSENPSFMAYFQNL